MPYYDYFCPSNGQTVEVQHGMTESLRTWGELAERAGLALEATPREAPVERLMSLSVPATGDKGATDMPMGGGCACGMPGGGCGMN